MDNSHRDRTIESLLRRREMDASQPTDQCVDAESLAAWMEGGLSGDARAAVEQHAAGCARCQALLASMARTAPDIDVRPWWRSVTAKWLVPVAAIATALVVWFSVGREPVPSMMQQAPSVEPSRPANPPESPAAPRAVPAPQTPESRTEPADKESTKRARSGDEEAGARQELDKKLDRRRDDQRLAAAAKPKASQAPQPVVSGGASAANDALRPQGQTMADSSARAAAPPPPATAAGAPAPAAPAAQPVNAAPVEAKPTPVAGLAESVSVSREVAAKQRAAGVAVTTPSVVEIQSPDPNYRWRILPPSAIQRSTDGGTTWSIVNPLRPAFRAGAEPTTLLTAGSSPSRDVCWIVGRSGTIFLSMDGATWQRRPFPENVDLAGIRASSATNAVATTADGRQFATSDGGATWVLMK